MFIAYNYSKTGLIPVTITEDQYMEFFDTDEIITINHQPLEINHG